MRGNNMKWVCFLAC